MSYGRNLAEEPLSALYEGDRPLRLGSQALDILVALVERAGELVSKGELMARVWPDTFVDESNIKVQVAALRRALRDGEKGSGYILLWQVGATGSSPLWRDQRYERGRVGRGTSPSERSADRSG